MYSLLIVPVDINWLSECGKYILWPKMEDIVSECFSEGNMPEKEYYARPAFWKHYATATINKFSELHVCKYLGLGKIGM